MTRKIKVFCNYRTVDKPWGGANNFVKTLKDYLEATGNVEFVHDINSRYDVLFMNSIGKGPGRPENESTELSPRETLFLKQFGSAEWRALFKAQESGKKIIFRSVNLDKSAFYRPFLSYRDVKVILTMNLVHRVVLQTAYMEPVFRSAGYFRRNSEVIHNGADSRIFNLENRSYWDGASPLRILSATFSDRSSKRFDTISAISRMPGVECIHIGRWPKHMNPANVRLCGVLSREELSAAMKHASVFLHPAERDPCPNVVQEALASGLPVIYSDDSGARELAEGCGVSLSSGAEEAIDLIRANYLELVERIRSQHEKFTIGAAAARYLDVIKGV
jgi:glycosyltransferase involved in cell wall biosynthesis